MPYFFRYRQRVVLADAEFGRHLLAVAVMLFQQSGDLDGLLILIEDDLFGSLGSVRGAICSSCWRRNTSSMFRFWVSSTSRSQTLLSWSRLPGHSYSCK